LIFFKVIRSTTGNNFARFAFHLSHSYNFVRILSIITAKGRNMSLPLKNKVRIVSAASLFDGHDAAINIMRRIMQAKGAEVIHLGHNRSAQEIVEAAIQEDAQGIALTSYQGGHVEFLNTCTIC
jgi:methylmalonyl-CoA mutase cobalamin-binding subunit